MSLTLPEIERMAGELAEVLQGAVIQKVWQPSPTALLFQLYKTPQRHKLLIETAARFSRIHLTTRSFDNPPAPPAFCQKLRKEIGGWRLDRIDTPFADRVVVVELTAPGAQAKRLITELTGHHANVFLCTAHDVIVARFKPSHSFKRLLAAGELYVPPLRAASRQLDEVSHRLRFEPPLSAAVDRHYETLEREWKRGILERSIRKPLKQRLDRTQRTLEKVQAELARSQEADVYRRRGELLKASYGLLHKGMQRAVVPDWSAPGQPPVEIALDPSLTPSQNIERCFRRYRKYRNAQNIIKTRLEQLEADAQTLRDYLLTLQEPDLSQQQLQQVLAATQQKGWLPKKAPEQSVTQRAEQVSLPYREFVSKDGLTIRVGRSARHNDALTFRHARGRDIWLHARGFSGSHVVIVMDRPGGPLPQETLLDAATLAAHYSRAKGESRVEIAYTERKHVRKPRHSPAGLVYLAQSKAMTLRPEPERLTRLLAQRKP